VTAAVVIFVWKARPEILESAGISKPTGSSSLGKVLSALMITAALTAGLISWFASTHPDGLEWSVSRSVGKEDIEPPRKSLYAWLAEIQEKTAFMPDYGFRRSNKQESSGDAGDAWPAVDPGRSLSGLLGGVLTLIILVLIGVLLKRRKKRYVSH
jgi:cobalt/nickel transport system permease protein